MKLSRVVTRNMGGILGEGGLVGKTMQAAERCSPRRWQEPRDGGKGC